MYYVYVLQSYSNKSLYVGYTADLKTRMKEHNEGKSIYTKLYKPWELVYYEAYKNKLDATKREWLLKHNPSGMRMIKRRLLRSLHDYKV